MLFQKFFNFGGMLKSKIVKLTCFIGKLQILKACRSKEIKNKHAYDVVVGGLLDT